MLKCMLILDTKALLGQEIMVGTVFLEMNCLRLGAPRMSSLYVLQFVIVTVNKC